MKVSMELYTDGSCLGNPGKGGWAAKCGAFTVSGGAVNVTNNIMELTAIIEGLDKCLSLGIRDVVVFTDSKYCMNGITSWIHNWKNRGWMTATGSPVKNKELWVRLDEIVCKFDSVVWKWVKAHNGNIHNEWVDNEARRRATNSK